MTLRGPQPPFVGAVYQARTRSGRKWEVRCKLPALPAFGRPAEEWELRPLGDDVRTWCNEDGELQGGVRTIRRTTDQLRNPRKWRMVGVTSVAAVVEGRRRR